MNLDESLHDLKTADDIKRAADRKFILDARRYVVSHVPAANERLAYMETFFRQVANPFVAKIQQNPAAKDPEIGKLLNQIKSATNFMGQLRMAIDRCQRISDEELLRWRHNWRAYVDTAYVAKLNPGNVEGLVRGCMGQIEHYVTQMTESAPRRSTGAETV